MTGLYYRIADMTLEVCADIPLPSESFAPAVRAFQVAAPGPDHLILRHHVGGIPNEACCPAGTIAGTSSPWTVSRHGDRWVYDGQHAYPDGRRRFLWATWDADHQHGDIYHPDARRLQRGGLTAVTAMTTDQILLASVLAAREGCLLHAAGMIIDGAGVVFVGHSGAGKSTMVTMLREEGTILCDDRVAVRRIDGQFRVYGTWSHGDVPEVSPASAPLRAVCVLEQAPTNIAIPLTKPCALFSHVLACLVRPWVTADWWEQTLTTVDALAQSVPAYQLRCDRSGRVVEVVRALLQ